MSSRFRSCTAGITWLMVVKYLIIRRIRAQLTLICLFCIWSKKPLVECNIISLVSVYNLRLGRSFNPSTIATLRADFRIVKHFLERFFDADFHCADWERGVERVWFRCSRTVMQRDACSSSTIRLAVLRKRHLWSTRRLVESASSDLPAADSSPTSVVAHSYTTPEIPDRSHSAAVDWSRWIGPGIRARKSEPLVQRTHSGSETLECSFSSSTSQLRALHQIPS